MNDLKIFNPFSGRRVKVRTPLGQSLLRNGQIEHIENPLTGHKVHVDGKMGKQILNKAISYSKFHYQNGGMLMDAIAKAYQSALVYTDPNMPIPDDLRLMRDGDVAKSDIGAGIICIFKTDDNLYVVYGLRFGKTAKLTVGGKVEIIDRTAMDTIVRELEEEFFHQLPLKNYILANKRAMSGGFEEDLNGNIKLKKWGPYFKFFALEIGYQIEELEQAVEIMNRNASLHFPVATFFGELEKLNPEEIKIQASELLQEFENNAGPDIIPLRPEVTSQLELLTRDPLSIPAQGGFAFAKKYVHDYTEYSAFDVIPFTEFIESNMEKFTGEKDDIDIAWNLFGLTLLRNVE